MRHGPSGKEEKRKTKIVPVGKRRLVRDCEPGDVVLFADGRRAVVTAWLNGGSMGRWLDDADGEGEMTSLDSDAPIKRIRGYR